MSVRGDYLPRRSVLCKMSDTDRLSFLENLRLWLARDIGHLEAGDVLISDNQSAAYYLKLHRAKMRRLVRLAQSFGHWFD